MDSSELERAHRRQDADHLGTLQPFVVRECAGETCGVRFPVAAAATAYEECHLCGSPTAVVAEIERHDGTTTVPAQRSIVAVLDNLRSARNVGNIIRTADGTGVTRMVMGGITASADNPKVHKTSLDAEGTVAWSHHRNVLPVIHELKASGHLIWALEATPHSVALDVLTPPPTDQPIAIVVGNEIAGVDPGILELCDQQVHLPMRGIKNSLNVAVAFGVIAWWLQQPA